MLVIAYKGFCVGIVSLVCIFSESPLMPQGFLEKCCEMLQNAANTAKMQKVLAYGKFSAVCSIISPNDSKLRCLECF